MGRSTYYSEPPQAPAPRRMRARDMLGEWRIAVDLLRLSLSAVSLLRLPKGDNQPVLLVPGFKAPEASMELIRRFLNSLGHDASHWGFGTNEGQPEQDRDRLIPKVEALQQQTGKPVVIIGWSLGGVIARETARQIPHAVSRVITYGSPVVGGPTYTLAAGFWGEDECKRIEGIMSEMDRLNPILTPITAIFSRRDAVVSWPACIDRFSPRVEHYEVGSTHLSMGFDPTVLHILAKVLVTRG